MKDMPDSVTAIVHARFHYKGEQEPEPERGKQRRLHLLRKILDGAVDMDPQLRRMLEEFAEHLKETPNGGEQSPD
ncbi:MAG: hypothetical protein ACOC6S_03360 [Chloroflexota bacterium]